MSVQSARVQGIVKADDVVLTHQIMHDVAYNAEQSRAPLMLNAADEVNFFYPSQDPTVTDLIGYPGVAVGGYPTSTFTVTIPGVIAPVGLTPARGTQTFQSGLGRTVRAEVIRTFATTPLKTTEYLIDEVDIFERGYPNSLEDTTGGLNPAAPPLNLE